MLKSGIRTKDIPAKLFILAHGLMTNPRVHVPLDLWDVFTQSHAIQLLSTLGNGFEWSSDGTLVYDDARYWVTDLMQRMLIAVQEKDLQAITQIKHEWRRDVILTPGVPNKTDSAKYHMDMLDSELELKHKFSHNPTLAQHALDRMRWSQRPFVENTDQSQGRPWVPGDPWVYHLVENSPCIDFPTNLRQDWLEVCFEVLEILASQKAFLEGLHEDASEAIELAQKALKELKRLYPGCKSSNDLVPTSCSVVEEDLGLHTLSIEEYLEKFPSNSNYLAEKTDSIEEGMLYWPLAPSAWGGPWEGDYVAYRICDTRKDTRESLPSQAEVIQKAENNFKTWVFYCPSAAFNRVFPQGIEDIAMTPEQGKVFRENLEPELLKLYDESNLERIEEFHKYELNGVATLEKPYELHLYGTDDCSYSKVFASSEEALDFLAQLRETSSWELVHSQMAFTN